MRAELKLTMDQIRRCYEILKLRYIDRANEEVYKAYRLEVKNRLFKQNQEELLMVAKQDSVRKQMLQQLYEEEEQIYWGLLARLFPNEVEPSK